jgi:hypothetical protein
MRIPGMGMKIPASVFSFIGINALRSLICYPPTGYVDCSTFGLEDEIPTRLVGGGPDTSRVSPPGW